MPTAARPPRVSLATLARPFSVDELSSMLRSDGTYVRHYNNQKRGKPAAADVEGEVKKM